MTTTTTTMKIFSNFWLLKEPVHFPQSCNLDLAKIDSSSYNFSLDDLLAVSVGMMRLMFTGVFNSMSVIGPALGYVFGAMALNIFTDFYNFNADE